MEGIARNYLKCKKVHFPKKLQVAYKNCHNYVFAITHLAINCERLVRKCARWFWTNAHESEAAEANCWLSWIQTQRHISFKVYLVGHARGTSHRIMPAKLLNRWRISSSSTYILSDLQEEREKGRYLTKSNDKNPYTSRNVKSAKWQNKQRHKKVRTSNRITPAQLLYRWRISSSSTYILSDLQEELLRGSCQHSYWTDGGSHLYPNTSCRTCKRDFT